MSDDRTAAALEKAIRGVSDALSDFAWDNDGASNAKKLDDALRGFASAIIALVSEQKPGADAECPRCFHDAHLPKPCEEGSPGSTVGGFIIDATGCLCGNPEFDDVAVAAPTAPGEERECVRCGHSAHGEDPCGTPQVPLMLLEAFCAEAKTDGIIKREYIVRGIRAVLAAAASPISEEAVEAGCEGYSRGYYGALRSRPTTSHRAGMRAAIEAVAAHRAQAPRGEA